MDDKKTFSEFIQPLKPTIFRTIWRIVRQPELSRDTLQETLTAIWENFGKIQAHPNPRALVIKISANKAYDSIRKYYFKSADLNEILEKSEMEFTGEKMMEAEEIRREVLHSVSRLSKKQAVAVYLRIVEGESYQLISQMMGCGAGTVRNHVKRGRVKLSKWLSHLRQEERKNE